MNPSIAEINALSKEDLVKKNEELARKLAIQMVALVWVKITLPRVAYVCLKHAAIRNAKLPRDILEPRPPQGVSVFLRRKSPGGFLPTNSRELQAP
jgi:hypothetical protein